MKGESEDPLVTWDSLAKSLGCEDVGGASLDLQQIAAFALPVDLFNSFIAQLSELLPTTLDSDRVLTNTQRYISASRSPHSLMALFERETDVLRTLVQLFSTSQYLAEKLIADPDALELLRLTGGQPVRAELLADEIMAEVHAISEIRQVQRSLRAFRHREMLRIAYGDFVCSLPIETVTHQISVVAESILQAAVLVAERELRNKRSTPLRADGRPARFSVIAMGKLGGAELNYSSDIDLLFVCDESADTKSWSGMSAADYFARWAQLIIRLLSESTSAGIAYRVDMRLRPSGSQGALVVTLPEALRYYENAGRTWERQAFVKSRAVAGSSELGKEFLEQMQPWIYRRYLTRADISGISALKRRIERQTLGSIDNRQNVKLGFGGIRDIEFVIQFLQLLNGGEHANLRMTNTLQAIVALEQDGCLTGHEREVLEANYRFMRRLEHYLQIMFDLQTHILPDSKRELERLAFRMGYESRPGQTADEQLIHELNERAQLNRRILNHLLHHAFPDDETASPESDLVLDPAPEYSTIESVLKPYGFRDVQQAYRHLMELSRENIRFLSTRRCRHFLSAIASRLLSAIRATPSPDSTLVNLAHISDSLGGKAVLWELFSANSPSMELCLRLCACSPYLVGILTSNPGMLDELLDSLMLGYLPSFDELDENLTQLCRNAEDIAPIVHSFKNSMHLRVGVRDILGKEEIVATHRCLSDIAEVCLRQVIDDQYHRLIQQLGVPTLLEGPRKGQSAELIVLALGKLGGLEPNYHSDLDVVFLFDGDGSTRSLVSSRRFEPTSNRHFFNQLSQRVIHAVTRTTTSGRLYDIDARLRPAGSSGELAITIDDLRKYFTEGYGRLWERQALCKVRAIWGSLARRQAAIAAVHEIVGAVNFSVQTVSEIYEMRRQLEKTASENNLKRGVGGTVDIEFTVQLLQLRCARTHPQVLVPRTLDALEQLQKAGQLDGQTATQLADNYRFLRSIESGLRLMNTSARHDLPTDENELHRLAFLIDYRGNVPIEERCQHVRTSNRELFESVFQRLLGATTPSDSRT